MSSVLAFTVKPESKFYADYFAVKKEQKRFHDIAVPFLKERGIEGRFYQTPFLAIDPDEDTLRKYRSQLRKHPDSKGFYHFLKTSDLEKAWESEVSAKINFSVLNALDFWCFDFIKSGKCTIWSWNGTVYGYLESKCFLDIVPNENWMQPIKMSEYYAAVESFDEENKRKVDA